MKDDRLYLVYVRECLERIEEYTAEGKEFFLHDRKGQDAVLRNLHTLAESTMRISDARKTKYPEVDWRGIAKFRNVVVHDYLGMDIQQVWDIVEQDLPNLKAQVVRILEQVDTSPDRTRQDS